MSVTYIESVMTLASCEPNYDEMSKEDFARKCIGILKNDGNFIDPEDKE